MLRVDCQKDGYEMDYDALEGAITPRTKAIIPVDIGGVICDHDRIFEIVRRKQPLFTPSDNAIQLFAGTWLWLPTQPMPLERAATEKCAARLQILPVFPSMRSKTLPPQRVER